MSVAAPPSSATRSVPTIPYAESQPQRVVRRSSPDWLPVIGWFVDDGVRHSRINVIPLGNTIDPFRIAADGSLQAAPGGPVGPAVAAPTLLGLAIHPTKRIIYVGLTAASQIAVFNYDAN